MVAVDDTTGIEKHTKVSRTYYEHCVVKVCWYAEWMFVSTTLGHMSVPLYVLP